MREILFRGKDILTGKWIYGNYVRNYNTVYIAEPDKLHINCAGIVTEVDRNTVGQYTGLKDKNGTKIFEGDIICWLSWDSAVCEREVFYDEEYNRYCVWLNGAESLGVNKHLSDDIEVIGNIHDNEEQTC